MRIGFDAKRLFSNVTGLGNYSRTLVKNLIRFAPTEEYYLYTTKVAKTEATAFFETSHQCQTILYEGPMKAFWRSYSLIRQVEKDQVDVFHGLSNEIPFPKGKGKTRRIVTIHDLIFKRLPHTYRAFDRAMYDWKFRHSCRQADRVIAISESTKSDIVQYYHIDPDRIEVIYQSCNDVYYEADDQSANQQILDKYQLPADYWLYVGSIAPRKNLELIIEAYRALPADLRLPLVVVGRGPRHQKTLMGKISRLPFSMRVHWVNNLRTDRELKSVYQEAQGLLYPSLFEGFGLPVSEAQLCGTPVITSRISSMPEAGGNYALYIDPAQPEEMASALERLAGDTEMRDKLIAGAYAHASQTFSPERLTRQLLDCYQKVLSQV